MYGCKLACHGSIDKKLTSKQVVFQTSFWHELVNQKSIFTFLAVSNEFNKIFMTKLAQVIDLRLQVTRI